MRGGGGAPRAGGMARAAAGGRAGLLVGALLAGALLGGARAGPEYWKPEGAGTPRECAAVRARPPPPPPTPRPPGLGGISSRRGGTNAWR